MTNYVERAELQVADTLANFVETQALPGTGVASADFWTGLSALVHDLGPKNRALLDTRANLQAKIDAWHVANRADHFDANAYQQFLRDIEYLVPEGEAFEIDTTNVDPEIANIPGPQLVVPITNARFALNAANARWGSLYDALYGTDALGDLPDGKGYDLARGARVVAWAKGFLDDAVPLAGGKWADVDGVAVVSNSLVVTIAGAPVALSDPAQYAGHTTSDLGAHFLFKNNGLGVEILVDPDHSIGATDPAGIASINLESAMSAIMDCEDSVAAVDAQDKVLAYSNWLGLMRGDLEEAVDKGGKTIIRKLNNDFNYTGPDGADFVVKRRSLMLVRNVGHLMTNPAIMDRDGREIGEGLMDAMMTTLIAMHDLSKTGGMRNSVAGSVYVVKPKMHGPTEVAFADEIFSRVEAVLGLPASHG